MEDAAGSVLDASALLAYLQDEPGSQKVQDALAAGAVISSVNYAEVLSHLADAGEKPADAHRNFEEQGLIGGLLTVVPLTEANVIVIAELRTATRARGLSLGDRACLATGLQLGRPIMTADRIWAAITVGADIRMIR